MLGKKLKNLLLPLVQLLPAVLVAAIVLVTLPGTAPVLAEVPQRLEPAAESTAESAASAEPEEEEPALPKLPYADGVWNIYYRFHFLGQFDAREKKIKPATSWHTQPNEM